MTARFTHDVRHEIHAASQMVVDVTTTPQDLDDLTPIPDWATGVRLYVGSASGIVYSTDGTDPELDVHGAPIEGGGLPHSILGRESILALALVAQTADVKVAVEFVG